MRIFYCVLLLTVFLLPAFSQETFTLTTYYPAPFGVYTELRAKRMAIGDNYYQQSTYPWYPDTPSVGRQIPQDADLVVEGNVGIGTDNPGLQLVVWRETAPTYGMFELTTFTNDNQQTFLIAPGVRIKTGEYPWDVDPDTVSMTASGTHYMNLAFGTGNVEVMRISTNTNVGIMTAEPKAQLDVNGEIRVGSAGLGCNTNTTGSMRYADGEMQYCDGSDWRAFGGGQLEVAQAFRGRAQEYRMLQGPAEAIVLLQNVILPADDYYWPSAGPGGDGLGCNAAQGWIMSGCGIVSEGSPSDHDMFPYVNGCITNEWDNSPGKKIEVTVTCLRIQ